MATRLFGTDGVRGLANGDLTAELALDLSVAAAHVLADRGDFEGHRPFAVVGRDTRISGEFLEAAVVAGLASAGVDVLLLGVLPDAGRRVPHRHPRRRPRRDALGVPQPDARQRHQVPRARRPQARRRDRARDRATAARAVGAAARRRRRPGAAVRRGGRRLRRPPDRVDRPPARRAQGRPRLRRGRGVRGRSAGAGGAGAEVVRHPRDARRPQHQRQLRVDPPRSRCRRRSSRTAPTSASPSTATPTAAWRSTTRATSSTATSSSRSSRCRCTSRAGWPRTPSSRR